MYFSLNQWEIGDTLEFYCLTKIMQRLSNRERIQTQVSSTVQALHYTRFL